MPTLHWIGKDKVVSHHLDLPSRVPEHKYGFAEGKESKKETGSGNKIIHGDNLEALKTLFPEYEGRIKCMDALQSVVQGLYGAGFSSKDYKIAESRTVDASQS